MTRVPGVRGGEALRRGAPLAAAVWLAVMLPGCTWLSLFGSRTTPGYRASIHPDSIASGASPIAVKIRTRRLPTATRSPASWSPGPAAPKVDSLLRIEINSAPPGDSSTVMVSFRDPLASRQAIQSITGDPMDPDTTHKVPRAFAINRLGLVRDSTFTATHAAILNRWGARVLKRFWLVQAVVVRMPTSRIDSVAADSEVVRIERIRGTNPPPTVHCGSPAPNPSGSGNLKQVRSLLQSDAYRPATGPGQPMALLDTGVESNHGLLAAPERRIRRMEDCEDDIGDCIDVGLQTDSDPAGHGTSSAAVMSGNGTAGEEHRGITNAWIDSYKVWSFLPSENRMSLNLPGSIEAVQHALDAGHRVIVVEVAEGCGHHSDLTTKANLAYDLGAAVIAANGNMCPRNQIPYPANAPRALGIGMYSLDNPGHFSTAQSLGRTRDQRIKPDLAGLTGCCTASGTVGGFRTHSGTSGATSVVGGAASLLLGHFGRNRDLAPGHLYALLLMSGLHPSVKEEGGVGLLRLPIGGLVWVNSVRVEQGKSLVLEFDPGDLPISKMDVAIWWPEYGTEDEGFPSPRQRAHIALMASAPSGVSSPPSDVVGSVFQRVSVPPTTASAAPWRMTIMGRNVPGGSRQVFYAAWGRP